MKHTTNLYMPIVLVDFAIFYSMLATSKDSGSFLLTQLAAKWFFLNDLIDTNNRPLSLSYRILIDIANDSESNGYLYGLLLSAYQRACGNNKRLPDNSGW